MRRPVVMGNWKLNGSKNMVTELISGLSRELEGVEGVDVAIAPPTLYLDLAERMLGESSSNIILGAQNTDPHNRCPLITPDAAPN